MKKSLACTWHLVIDIIAKFINKVINNYLKESTLKSMLHKGQALINWIHILFEPVKSFDSSQEVMHDSQLTNAFPHHIFVKAYLIYLWRPKDKYISQVLEEDFTQVTHEIFFKDAEYQAPVVWVVILLNH